MTGTNEQRFADLQERFAAWRRERPHRSSRIPEALWQAAVQVARELGVSKTSELLGVDYYSLKGRLGGTPPKGTRQRAVEFVEIPGKVLSAGPGCVVELQDRRGIRLRVELCEAVGAESLARSLWRSRR
jgi:hypothetical protein